MSETRWSPGPWRSSFKTKANEQIACVYGTAASGRAADEAKANAHIIAAASDLYSALADAETTIAALMKSGGAFDVPATMEKIARALAKARGES